MKKLKLNTWVWRAMLSFLNRSSILVINFVTFAILIRNLSIQDWGTYELFISIVALIEISRNGLVKTPLIRFAHDGSSFGGEKGIFYNSLVINIIYSALVSTLFWIASPLLVHLWEADNLNHLLKVFIFISISASIFSNLEFLMILKFRYKIVLVAYIIQKGLLLTFVILTLFFQGNITLTNVIHLQLTANVGAVLIFLWMARKFVPSSIQISKSLLKRLLSYGKVTFATNLGAVVSRNINLWLLGALVSPSAVAFYGPALRISNLYEVPSMALTNVNLPRMAKLNDIKKNLKIYEKSVAYLFGVIFPFSMLILVFSEQIVVLIAGQDYSLSSTILKITVLYGLISPFNKQFGILMDTNGKASVTLSFMILSILINIMLNYFFINLIGLLGAAIATLVSYLIIFTLMQIYLKIKYQVSMISYINSIGQLYLTFYRNTRTFFAQN